MDGTNFLDGIDFGELDSSGEMFGDSASVFDGGLPESAPWEEPLPSDDIAALWESAPSAVESASAPWETPSLPESASAPWEAPSLPESASAPWEASNLSNESASAPWEAPSLPENVSAPWETPTSDESASAPWEISHSADESASAAPWETHRPADESAAAPWEASPSEESAAETLRETAAASDEERGDTLLFDSNNDGVNDTAVIYETAENGEAAETVTKAYDDDQDGEADRIDRWRDTDGDGQFDSVDKLYTDADHNLHYHTAVDLDGDGLPEWEAEGVLSADETAAIWSDYRNIDWEDEADGSLAEDSGLGGAGGVLDFDLYGPEAGEELCDFEAETAGGSLQSETEAVWADWRGADLGGTYSAELENFEPYGCDPDLVVGDPAASMENWEFQGPTNRCGLYSQKFVLEELTGQSYSIDDLTDLAEKQGWFDESCGTPLLNLDKVLDHCGIKTELTFHNGLSDIERHLQSGHKLICTVDADEIWNGQGGDLFSPCSAPNHAVQIIGVDRSGGEPMIILNDSGTPGGRGEMVPYSAFSDAWEDGDRALIVAEAGGN